MAGPWEDFQPAAADGPWADFAPAKPKPPARPKRNIYGEVAGFMANVNRGLGVGDEIAAAAKTGGNLLAGKVGLGGVASDFKNSLASQRGLEDEYAADRPMASAFARGTGNALTMAAPAGPGAAAFATGGKAVNALRGATVAGLSGAGYAAVDRGTLAERATGAAKAAVDPATLALGAGAGSIAARGRRAQRGAAPTLDELSAQRDAAYRAVDESGVQYPAEAFGGLTEDMARALDAEGFNAGLHPKTAAMMERLGQSIRATDGYSPTLTQLDQLRQQIGRDVASSPDPGERRMGAIMRAEIDRFIDEGAAGSADITRARDLNTRVAKLRSLDNLDEAAADRAAATGSGGNVGNATRQNVIRFQRDTRNLTPDEAAATQRVIRGTNTGNALRQFGKLSPAGNGLMLAGHIAAAVPTGGVSGVVGAGGALAKVASDAITARDVAALRRLIAEGGDAARTVAQALDDPQYADLRQQLANDLAVAAGVQGASRRGAVEVEVIGHPEYGRGVSSR